MFSNHDHELDIPIENPYGAAQRFLERNDLPLAHLDTVVQFIEKNTAGVNIGTGGNEYVDPYTGETFLRNGHLNLELKRAVGASRYQASANSFPTSSTAAAPPSSYMDPFTGASRYSGDPQPPPSALGTTGVIPVVMHPLLIIRYCGSHSPVQVFAFQASKRLCHARQTLSIRRSLPSGNCKRPLTSPRPKN